LGIYKGDLIVHRRKIKFTNLERNSFIEEMKIEKPILGMDLPWFETARYHYEGSGPP
jgi:hypothetical protein